MKKKNLPCSKSSGFLSLLRPTLIALLIFVSCLKSKAQIISLFENPTVSVYIQHPPDLSLKVKKIAFAPATGECSDQIVNAITSEFVTYRIEVVDRENLKTILAEHSFTLTGSVDQTSAATMGKILGPSALIFVKVLRCATQQDRLYDTEKKYSSQTGAPYNATVNISRTKAFLTVSIQVVDLTTSKIFAAQTLNYSPEKSNRSYTGYPEFPTTFEVQDMAFKSAVEDVHHMFLPWGEYKTVEFFDDKDFKMKEAFKALKDGNIDLAFNTTKQGLEECNNDNKVKDKKQGHINYNMGICYMLKYKYDSALVFLNEASKFISGDNVKKAINDCQQAQSLQKRSQTLEQIASYETKKQKEEEDKRIQADAENTLTNKSIMDMVQLKLPESVILQKIKSSKCKFDTTPDALATLTKSGVSEKIMMAMIEKQ